MTGAQMVSLMMKAIRMVRMSRRFSGVLLPSYA
jgi:hypothetical protein